MYHKDLELIFDKHGLSPEAKAEIRHIFAIVRRDAERDGYSEGWEQGQSLCDFDR